jgi:hypothetical protein
VQRLPRHLRGSLISQAVIKNFDAHPMIEAQCIWRDSRQHSPLAPIKQLCEVSTLMSCVEVRIWYWIICDPVVCHEADISRA